MRPAIDPDANVKHGSTHKRQTPCGNLYVTVNVDEEGKPCEIFCRLGKPGGCAAAWMSTLGRVISSALEQGCSLPDFIKQLGGVTCHNQISKDELGCIHQLSVVLAKYLPKEE